MIKNIPYTTAQLLTLLRAARPGIKYTRAYIPNVIMREARRTPHPLKAAKINRGMWDRQTVDNYFQTKTPSS